MNFAHKRAKGYLFVAVISDDSELTTTELVELLGWFGTGYFNVSEGVWGNCHSDCLENISKQGWTFGGRAETVLNYMAEMGTLNSQAKAAKKMKITPNI